MRFASSRPASRIGENRALGMSHEWVGGRAGGRQHKERARRQASRVCSVRCNAVARVRAALRPRRGACLMHWSDSFARELYPRKAERSAPSGPSDGSPRAYSGEIAPPCSNASSGRCETARRSARADARPVGATYATTSSSAPVVCHSDMREFRRRFRESDTLSSRRDGTRTIGEWAAGPLVNPFSANTIAELATWTWQASDTN